MSGDTLVSGIPKIPGEEKPPSPSAFAQAPAGEGDSAAPKPRPKIPEPINPPKSGRNKFVLLGVAVVVLAGFAYGAGLLLDHADVPNGTTALGVDIGGKTKEEAVAKLEKALKDSRTAPIKLSVDGKSVTLRPAKAGLDIDPQATVRKAAGRDYNPVSVIGSLVGVHRTAEPEVIVDDEKLQIALENATGPGGATEDGGITFEGGKAVAHYGAPHKAIDVAASKKKVADAYRKRAVSGTDAPVVLAMRHPAAAGQQGRGGPGDAAVRPARDVRSGDGPYGRGAHGLFQPAEVHPEVPVVQDRQRFSGAVLRPAYPSRSSTATPSTASWSPRATAPSTRSASRRWRAPSARHYRAPARQSGCRPSPPTATDRRSEQNRR